MIDDNDPLNPQSIAYARAQAARQGGGLSEGAELEREAVAFVKQYGLFLPAPAKAFLRKLADYLKWDNLKGILK